MLGTSRFLVGLLREMPDAVAAQVELWNRSTVALAAWDQVAARSQTARDAQAAFKEHIAKPVAQKIQTGLKTWLSEPSGDAANSVAEDRHPIDGHVVKFCQLAAHARLKLHQPPETAQLHDMGFEIERDAVRSLREADNRSPVARIRGEARKGFDGTSIDDLVRHVIQQTFQAIDAEFRKKSPAEQEEMAERIATALRDLPPEEQERIRRSARLPDLTAETLRQTGILASLGFGVSSLVGVAGFSAYTTLTSLVAGITGLIGIHLSFGTYMAMTSMLAGFANPLLLVPMIAGGGAWMTSKANRSIRGTLYPTLVATSVLAYTADEDRERGVAAFRERLASLIVDINNGNGERLLLLVRRFPGLGNPPLSARIACHVAT